MDMYIFIYRIHHHSGVFQRFSVAPSGYLFGPKVSYTPRGDTKCTADGTGRDPSLFAVLGSVWLDAELDLKKSQPKSMG